MFHWTFIGLLLVCTNRKACKLESTLAPCLLHDVVVDMDFSFITLQQ